MWSRWSICLILLIGWAFAVQAATPPPLVNYQGVLRDNNDKPLTGTFDMTFGFYDAPSAGNQILLDAHSGGGAVGVSGGQFNVQLGGGVVTDGSGPGAYTALDQVFRDTTAVWMEIVVGSETLAPRIRVVGSPYALNASNLEGRNAAGFIDTSATGQTKAGTLNVNGGLNVSGTGYGLVSNGTQTGGAFGAGSTFAYVADTGSLKSGIRAQGDDAGGWFVNNVTGSKAYCAYGAYGIQAQGASFGGSFSDNHGDSAYLATSNGLDGWGIATSGTTVGGEFSNAQSSVFAALGGTGVFARGGTLGGRFENTQPNAGSATLADGSYGLLAHSPSGFTAAGFDNGGASSAYLSSGNWGLTASGSYCGVACGGGGFFRDTGQNTSTYVAYSNVGIETHASGSGGSFYNTNGIATALAAGSFGVSSNGTKSFVQNHPDDPGSVIAYAALEGDEAGTYTRGTARLIDGEARIQLGETFKWVTNPDIGLTAHLTPVGEWADLYVASKSTKEIVVRSRDPRAGAVAFDYIVFGLRIGFENNPVVRDKEHEMPIPAAASGESLFSKKPELQRFTALSRFSRAWQEVAGRDVTLDLGATESLKAKIHVFDPVRDGDAFRASAAPPAPAAFAPTAGATAPPRAVSPSLSAVPGPSLEADTAGTPSFPPNTSAVSVEGTVRAGDVVTVTGAPDGEAVLAGQALDTGVIGIVGGVPDASWTGRAPLVMSGVVALCNVDATGGAIAVGDLLVSSPTPGHAMRAKENPIAGTVIAKALEALEGGTGTIRVLVLSR